MISHHDLEEECNCNLSPEYYEAENIVNSTITYMFILSYQTTNNHFACFQSLLLKMHRDRFQGVAIFSRPRYV